MSLSESSSEAPKTLVNNQEDETAGMLQPHDVLQIQPGSNEDTTEFGIWILVLMKL